MIKEQSVTTTVGHGLLIDIGLVELIKDQTSWRETFVRELQAC